MKILFITSFYTSLQESILSGKWEPQGMPAISHLFEGLKKKKIPFDVLFIHKNSKSNNMFNIKNSYFSNTFHIFYEKNPTKIKILKNILYPVLLFKKIYTLNKILRKTNYDVFYIDRANIILGAYLTLIGKKVILRLHGISNLYDDYIKIKTRLLNPITFLSFRSSFSYVIGTNDGSPIHDFIKRFTKKSVPSKVIMNGINNFSYSSTSEKKSDIPKNLPILLFNGRHSEDKGILEFVNTIFSLIEEGEKFYTIILGNGKFYEEILNMINSRDLKNILLTGAIANQKVYTYYKLSDVYISLNKLGNLSNTVLEAIQAEKCIITLDQSDNSTKDKETKKFLLDSVIYINRENIENDLKKILKTIIDDSSIIETKKNKIKNVKTKLMTWEERINYEIEIISKI